MKTFALLALLACAACTAPHPLTSCRGSYQPANPGKWTPAAADLTEAANP